ncbi:hypothetical protein HUJ05_013216 [Dendroctonus ponderosae]|nr:hypothetical protein HUJ05_013216 [Dendroctonus ponderosae]
MIAPSHTPNNIIRNQIDYITINNRYCIAVKPVKNFPGADVSSDHNLLLLGVHKLDLKKVKQPKQSFKLGIDHLNQKTAASELERKLEEAEHQINIEDHWNQVKTLILNTTSGMEKDNEKTQQWMTNEILGLMDESRKCKNKDAERYRKAAAKEAWYEDRCEEIEELQRKHDYFNMYRKVIEIAGLHNKTTNNLIYRHDQLNLNDQDKLKRWKEYIQELFYDERSENDP